MPANAVADRGDQFGAGPGHPGADRAHRHPLDHGRLARTTGRAPGSARTPPAAPRGSRPSRSAAPSCRPGPGCGRSVRRSAASRASSRRRRTTARRWSAQARRAMPSSQVRALDRPSNAGQRPERPQVGLLGQVVGGVRIDQRGGEPPHLGLGGPTNAACAAGSPRRAASAHAVAAVERRRGRERTLGWYHGNPGYADRALATAAPTPVRVGPGMGIVGNFSGSRPTTSP